MAYTEKLLPVSDLFAAWQNRRAMETQDNGATKERERLQNELLAEQLKKQKLETMLLTPQPKNPVMDSPYSIGFPAYQQEQERIKNIQLLQGNYRPGGGGGGWGMRGSGADDQGQPAAAPTMSYTGPDHSQNTVESAAGKLAQLYQKDVPPPQEPSIYERLVEEDQNRRGLQSLIDQGAAKGVGGMAQAESGIMAGSSPVANEAAREFNKQAAGVVAGAQQRDDAKTTALNKASRELQSFPGFDKLSNIKQKELLANVEQYVADALGSGKTVVDWGAVIRNANIK